MCKTVVLFEIIKLFLPEDFVLEKKLSHGIIVSSKLFSTVILTFHSKLIFVEVEEHIPISKKSTRAMARTTMSLVLGTR